MLPNAKISLIQTEAEDLHITRDKRDREYRSYKIDKLLRRTPTPRDEVTKPKRVSEMRKEIIKSGLLNTVQIVITSPLRRAMQTSVGIFRGQEDMNHSDIFPKVNNSPPILALEICRERMRVMKMLYGKQRGKTWKRFLLEAFAFSNDHDGVTVETSSFVMLWERPEKDIAVVSHGIFLQQTLRALHEKVGTPLEDHLLKRFANCELRSIRIERSDMEAYTLTSCNYRKYVTLVSTSLHTLE
ncbi:hypothetical protein HA466_0245790 [Hirschfeldia incana]|nr:hypothetical protein HA466_0245790 [Hirschfeldia incana]